MIRSLYACYAVEVVKFGQEVPDPSEVWDATIKHAVDRKDPCLVAEVDSRIVGMVLLVLDGTGRRLFNVCLYVLPDFRREGIGSKLLNSARQDARQKGYLSIFDTVSLANEPAIGLMPKLGIRPVAYAYAFTP